MRDSVDPKFLEESVFGNGAWERFGIDVKKPALSESTETDQVEEGYEEVEAHTCPLCESTLDEAISDERLDEHFSEMIDILDEVLSESFDEEGNPIQESEDPDEEDENFIQQ